MSRSKVAVVTGAAAGIGSAIATRLLHDGFRVFAMDVDASNLEEFVRDLCADNGSCESIVADVTDATSVADAFDRVHAAAGGCDVLVNNAGVLYVSDLTSLTSHEWSKTMDVNVTGALLTSRAAVPHMVANGGGRIVNLASISGMRASAGRTAYGTSKAAVIGLTRQLAIELAPLNITVNAVAPGPVDTPMTRAGHTAATRQDYERLVPMRRYGTPEEIAAVISFLASSDSSYVTGHTIPVDGGFMAAGVLQI